MKISGLNAPALVSSVPELRAMKDVITTGVEEASDLALLPDGSFLAVSDLHKELTIVERDGDCTDYELDCVGGETSGFEAVTFDPERKEYLVVSEEKSKIYRYDLNLDLIGKHEIAIDGDDNKGCEGMAFIPAAGSPTGKAVLLLAKEAEPKQLLLLDASGNGALTKLDLPKALKHALADIAGVCYDPVSKHIFVASEHSAILAECAIVGQKVLLLGTHPLVNADGEKLERVEGIAADAKGIYALTENDGLIHRFAR